MAKQTVVWEHPVLGVGHYIRDAASPRAAAEECSDVFAGQPVRIHTWEGERTTISTSDEADYVIDNG